MAHICTSSGTRLYIHYSASVLQVSHISTSIGPHSYFQWQTSLPSVAHIFNSRGTHLTPRNYLWKSYLPLIKKINPVTIILQRALLYVDHVFTQFYPKYPNSHLVQQPITETLLESALQQTTEHSAIKPLKKNKTMKGSPVQIELYKKMYTIFFLGWRALLAAPYELWECVCGKAAHSA